MLEKYLTFFKAHEKLLALIILAGVTLFSVNKFLDKRYDASVAREQAANAVLKDQVSKNADIQKSVDGLQQQYAALLAGVQKQNAALTAAIAARNQTATAQQKTDADLSLQDLATRQQTLAGTTGIASTSDGLTESPAAAIAVTQQLELLPVLRQDNQDLQAISGDKDKQLTSITAVVNGQNDQISGLKTQLVDSQKSCEAQVAVARKSKWKFFKAGAVVGFVAGVLVGHRL
jgi:K+-sensing histidine kinase KdpD